MSKKTIHLHGYLKQLVPEPVVIHADTVAEAINGLCKVTKALNPDPVKGKHVIRVKGFDRPESFYCPTDVEELHLYPDFSGGKQGGFLQIAVAAVLIAASFISGAQGIMLPLLHTTLASSLFAVGVSMALGGVLAIMSPAPHIDLGSLENDPEASKYLGSPQNTVKVGTRIPFAYGEVLHGGHFISFDIQAQDVAV